MKLFSLISVMIVIVTANAEIEARLYQIHKKESLLDQKSVLLERLYHIDTQLAEANTTTTTVNSTTTGNTTTTDTTTTDVDFTTSGNSTTTVISTNTVISTTPFIPFNSSALSNYTKPTCNYTGANYSSKYNETWILWCD